MGRSLNELIPEARAAALLLIAGCSASGIALLVTCTRRTHAEQAALYALGRTIKGPIVTNAKAGHSEHEFGRALDVVPIENGVCLWDTTTAAGLKRWQTVGAVGERVGFDWGGNFKSFRDYSHFQLKANMKTLVDGDDLSPVVLPVAQPVAVAAVESVAAVPVPAKKLTADDVKKYAKLVIVGIPVLSIVFPQWALIFKGIEAFIAATLVA